jgi:hypothetical protein
MNQVGKDIAMQLRGKYDFETIVDVLDSWRIATGFPTKRDRDGENNRHTFIVQHNMGRKSSVFVGEDKVIS